MLTCLEASGIEEENLTQPADRRPGKTPNFLVRWDMELALDGLSVRCDHEAGLHSDTATTRSEYGPRLESSVSCTGWWSRAQCLLDCAHAELQESLLR